MEESSTRSSFILFNIVSFVSSRYISNSCQNLSASAKRIDSFKASFIEQARMLCFEGNGTVEASNSTYAASFHHTTK